MFVFIAITQYILSIFAPAATTVMSDTVVVKKTEDFTITGDGKNIAWQKADWQQLNKLQTEAKEYKSSSKILYSTKGLYVLFTGEDQRITTKNYKDDDDIYEGDVFELFLRTDISKPHYFEYEINPLGKQLILILAGLPHNNLAWSPWRHEYEQH